MHDRHEKNEITFNPFMPGGMKMYRQRAKISNLSDFDDTCQSLSFGRQMGLRSKNFKNPPSSLFLGINGLNCSAVVIHNTFTAIYLVSMLLTDIRVMKSGLFVIESAIC